MSDLQNNKVANGGVTSEGLLPPGEYNQLATEEINLITKTLQTPSSGDLNQVGKAVAHYAHGGNTYVGGGVANAYVLSKIGTIETPQAYFDGMKVFAWMLIPNTAAGVTINVDGLGAVPVLTIQGTTINPGDIRGWTCFIYSSARGGGSFIIYRQGTVIQQVITTTSVYTPALDVQSFEYIVIGGGGGGGGADGQGAGTCALGSGGSGAASSQGIITDIAASYTATIGVGGVGGIANANGAAGGQSSLVGGSLNAVAAGGNGGIGALGTSGSQQTQGQFGPTGTGGQINNRGGTSRDCFVVSGDPSSSGIGGESVLGVAGDGGVNSNGGSGIFGGGGGGAGALDTTNNFNGGPGGDGVIIIKEYY